MSGMASMNPRKRLGFHAAGQDRVDPDPRREFDGRQLGELAQRRLGEAVGEEATLVLLADIEPMLTITRPLGRACAARMTAELERCRHVEPKGILQIATDMSM